MWSYHFGDDASNSENSKAQRVQNALKLVFAKFAEFQSARQVHIWLRDEGIELPVKSRNGEARGIQSRHLPRQPRAG